MEVKDQKYYNKLYWENKNKQWQIELYGKVRRPIAMTDVQKATSNYMIGKRTNNK